MFGRINLLRLFDWSMIEPQNDVMIIFKLWSRHRDGLVSVVGKDSKGAGSIKSNAANAGRVNVLLVEDTLDRCANTTPDIVGRLFLDILSATGSNAGYDRCGKLGILT